MPSCFQFGLLLCHCHHGHHYLRWLLPFGSCISSLLTISEILLLHFYPCYPQWSVSSLLGHPYQHTKCLNIAFGVGRISWLHVLFLRCLHSKTLERVTYTHCLHLLISHSLLCLLLCNFCPAEVFLQKGHDQYLAKAKSQVFILILPDLTMVFDMVDYSLFFSASHFYF